MRIFDPGVLEHSAGHGDLRQVVGLGGDVGAIDDQSYGQRNRRTARSRASTFTTSPTATLYCLPPVLTIAYVAIVSSALSLLRARATGRCAGVLGGGRPRRRRPASGKVSDDNRSGSGYVTSW